MSLDATFILAFTFVFIRCTAMILSSPLYGAVVPVMIRIMTGVVISLALTPVLKPYIGEMPTNLIELAMMAGREVLIGLTIGFCLQFLLGAFQMAGSLLDLQMGIGSAQLFNPQSGGSSTPVGHFKFWLALVLIFLVNGHQMMFQAFMQSYQMTTNMEAIQVGFVDAGIRMFGSLLMIALQIGAPVLAVTMIIDVAAGIINKAVPQAQPFLLSLPAKTALGMVALSIGLPVMVVAVSRGLDITFSGIGKILGG